MRLFSVHQGEKKLLFLSVKAAAGGSYIHTHFIPRIPENYLPKKKKDNILKKTCFVLISVNLSGAKCLVSTSQSSTDKVYSRIAFFYFSMCRKRIFDLCFSSWKQSFH